MLTLYETKQRFYIVAAEKNAFRLLKIDRSFDPLRPALALVDDHVSYSAIQVSQLLNMITDGNRTSGGLHVTVPIFYGIIGFVRFTAGWYIVMVRNRAPVALLGGHYIYHCEAPQILPLSNYKPERSSEEAKLLHSFQQVDLSKNFYFSYSYDLTATLQNNLLGLKPPSSNNAWGYNTTFLWNHRLLTPAFSSFEQCSPWAVPLIYGFVDQAKLNVYGRSIYITLIARRSKHFAGARFIKRGVNDQGYVANDVETEQIVSDALNTPFHLPAYPPSTSLPRRPNPGYTSYVQHRGSIPIKWSQDTTNMTPKPMIDIALVDPYHTSAALHFDDLFSRYGSPVTILNLIKSKERTPRESKLLGKYKECINYLNQFLPSKDRILYQHFDIAWENKYGSTDVITALEDIAEETLHNTYFFHSGPSLMPSEHIPSDEPLGGVRDTPLLQQGVCRTNCIDCLDRTNAAQFVIGKTAFGYQLQALGIIKNHSLPFDSDAINMLTEMYHDHGDTIALQYGGSHLAHTMETYRKINQWTSHSRDMIEGFRRFYANSFADADKQSAIDLFLGVDENKTITSFDDNSHNDDKSKALVTRRSYRNWYTPEYLEPRVSIDRAMEFMQKKLRNDADYWLEYYRPHLLTDISRHFAYKMNSTARYTHGGLIANNNNSNNNIASPATGNVSFNNNTAALGYRRNIGTMPSSPYMSLSEDLSPFVPKAPSRGGGRAKSQHNLPPTTSNRNHHIVNNVYNWVKASVNRQRHSSSKQGRRRAGAGGPGGTGANGESAGGGGLDQSVLSGEEDEEDEYYKHIMRISRSDTEALALKSLAPRMHSDDAGEYTRYVHQYSPGNSSAHVSRSQFSGEREYRDYIHRSKYFAVSDNVNDHDIMIYENSVFACEQIAGEAAAMAAWLDEESLMLYESITSNNSLRTSNAPIAAATASADTTKSVHNNSSSFFDINRMTMKKPVNVYL